MSHPVIVRESTENGHEQFDVYSRLFEDRIIYIDTDFNDYMSSLVVSQLLCLSNKSKEDITIYINSPGGVVTSGLAIYDTMQMIENKVKTIVTGSACSMGAFILSGGNKGYRFSTPSSRIMIHMASGGAEGTTKDVTIRLEELKRINNFINERLAIHCNKTIKQIEEATDRDLWLTAKEAKTFGLIDDIIIPTHKNCWK